MICTVAILVRETGRMVNDLAFPTLRQALGYLADEDMQAFAMPVSITLPSGVLVVCDGDVNAEDETWQALLAVAWETWDQPFTM